MRGISGLFRKNIYNKNHADELISQLKQTVEDAHSSGKISEQTKDGFLQGTIEKTPSADRPGLRGSTENGQLAVRKLAESGINSDSLQYLL